MRKLMRLDPWLWIDDVSNKVHLGSTYGGWAVLPDRLNSNSIVLSVGIGTDISFDLAMIERFGCRIHGYDPTPFSIAWLAEQSLPAKFVTHKVGLAAADGTIDLQPPACDGHVSFHTAYGASNGTEGSISVPVRRLGSLLKELGTSHCDLLKMDIEGAEYDVCEDIVAHGPRPSQLLVEFHHRLYGFSVVMTEATIKKLRSVGYRVFWISETGREFGLALDRDR
ncbi:FkbM family methyltransferase [Benzoatithermus flavus]|uniref:FkbM family methyltransferase n=1 Tax=Benzoatithermus flavus TaxID=3108223 RepID=A0ABU8XRL2_9PROT